MKYHLTCIAGINEKRCPYCRQPMNGSENWPVYTDSIGKKQHDAAIAEINLKLKRATKSVNDLMKHNATLTNRNDTLSKRVRDMQDDITPLMDSKTQLIKTVRQLRQEAQDSKKWQVEKRCEIQDLRDDNFQLRKEAARHNDLIPKLQAQVKRLSGQTDESLRNEARQKHLENEALNEKLIAQEKAMDTLRKQGQQRDDINLNLRTKLSHQEQTNTHLLEDRRQKEELIDTLRTQNDVACVNNIFKAGEITTLRAELTGAQEANDNLREEGRRQEQAISNLRYEANLYLDRIEEMRAKAGEAATLPLDWAQEAAASLLRSESRYSFQLQHLD